MILVPVLFLALHQPPASPAWPATNPGVVPAPPPSPVSEASPLPPPRPPVDPSTIAKGPWRGRMWLSFGLEVVAAVGGDRPAAGTLVALAPGFGFGVRLHNAVGIYTGISLFHHDAEWRRGINLYGDRVKVTQVGRIAAFDLVMVRAFVPIAGRFQPFLDVGGGVLYYNPPFPELDPARAGGTLRTGLGFDGWVSRTVTLGLTVHYRLIGLAGRIGHGVVAAANLGLHF